MVTVELVDALFVDEVDGQVAVRDARGLERGAGGALEARIVCLDLDQRDARRRRSEVWPAAWSS
jgi:hypothetical protein